MRVTLQLQACLMISICLMSFSHFAIARPTPITVGLEAFPPLVNKDGSGLVIDMLNSLQQESSLIFDYQMMTYARAKNELKHQRVDMIGLTPKSRETPDFNQYAQDLSWHIDATVDFYSTSPRNFTIEKLLSRRVGTLIGNADFFAKLAGLPRERFIEVGSLTQLIMMALLGRIDIIIFERVAMMSTIRNLRYELDTKIASKFHSPDKPHLFYYQKLKVIPASFSVANNSKGTKLKQQLDTLLRKSDSKQYFTQFSSYGRLPDRGVVE